MESISRGGRSDSAIKKLAKYNKGAVSNRNYKCVSKIRNGY